LFSEASDAFYFAKHKVIYEAIITLLSYGITPDLISLIEQLRKHGTLDKAGGSHYLTEIARLTPTYANISQHTHLLLEFHIKRSLIILSQQITQKSFTADSDALDLLLATQNDLQVITRAITTSKELTGGALSTAAFEGLGKIHKGEVVKTGFYDLDEMLGGLLAGNYVLFGARPGVGKTALALSMAINMLTVGKKVCFFSLEMNATEVWCRLAAIFTGISLRELRTNPYIEQKQVVREFAHWLDSKFIFDGSALDELTVQSKVKHYKQKYGIDCVFIDYIGLMQCSVRTSTDNERLERISRSIKLTAMTTEIPIMVLSQLNREVTKRKDGIPCMADLRGSGAMEQDADIIVFPHRPAVVSSDSEGNVVENMSSETMLIVEKHRHGSPGFLKNSIRFVKHLAKFENIPLNARGNPPNIRANPPENVVKSIKHFQEPEPEDADF
jgi:replicative DNA helicase